MRDHSTGIFKLRMVAGVAPEQLPENAGRRLAVARGCGAQSYVLALEVALEHLACSEAGERVHVGT